MLVSELTGSALPPMLGLQVCVAMTRLTWVPGNQTEVPTIAEQVLLFTELSMSPASPALSCNEGNVN